MLVLLLQFAFRRTSQRPHLPTFEINTNKISALRGFRPGPGVRQGVITSRMCTSFLSACLPAYPPRCFHLDGFSTAALENQIIISYRWDWDAQIDDARDESGIQLPLTAAYHPHPRSESDSEASLASRHEDGQGKALAEESRRTHQCDSTALPSGVARRLDLAIVVFPVYSSSANRIDSNKSRIKFTHDGRVRNAQKRTREYARTLGSQEFEPLQYYDKGNSKCECTGQ
ncbi:hypothetical protein B0H19DRAFT_145610 [Mycena capillaripes]|nr:hypothetical protein B0H19DRAFT_145610 [Mycena capillaripes]